MKNMAKTFSLALVTGATSGLGEQLARLFASKKIPLIITGRNSDKLQSLKGELQRQVAVQSIQADLETAEGRKKIVDAIHAHAPDLVINSAGFGVYGDVLMNETDVQLNVMQVNVNALIEFTIEAARTLVTVGKKGTIMNISSAAAFPIFPGFAVYSASKACVNQFSESFNAELKPYGIHVLAACPGVIPTQFRERAKGHVKEGKGSIEVIPQEEAVQEIWKQICDEKPLHIFNWYYRFRLFLVKYLIPKALLAPLIHKNMQQIRPPTPIIKIKQ